MHPESISKMLHILGITDHMATSQLDTVKTSDSWRTQRRIRITCKLAQSALPSTHHTPTVNISDFLDKILKFRYWPARFN